MSGVPGDDRSDAGGHERTSREDFRAQVQSRKADLERQFEASKAQFDQAQEKIKARTGRNLILAILIGLAFGGTLLLSLLVIKELFMLFAVVLAGFAAWELSQALRGVLEELGFHDVRGELKAFLSGPESYRESYEPRVVESLVRLAAEARMRNVVREFVGR